jgi:uncharacterized protein YcfJ
MRCLSQGQQKDRIMRKTALLFVVMLGSGALLAGCTENKTANVATGAVVGGLIGNQFGNGSGRTAATVAGAAVGAAIAANRTP